MYVRNKIVKGRPDEFGNEKPYSYWQVVASHRTPEGPRQKVVAYIGKADDKEHADRKARSLGILCGVLDCPEPATVPLEHPETGFVATQRQKMPDGPDWVVGYSVCPHHLTEWLEGKPRNAVALWQKSLKERYG
jgi:hypothetical protein